MPIDQSSVDYVLSTTRSVRKRLDLTRDVSDELIYECVDLAEQAPTGGNISSRRWMVVRDPATRAAVADLYRAAGGDGIVAMAERLRGTGHPSERVMASGAYLAQHLQDVPVVVIACIWGRHDNSGRPGLFDSVLQAAWSFCLAARARDLGTAWTTLHLAKAPEFADLLGIPDGVTQAVLMPLAYTVGTDFQPAARRPAAQITYFDRWGFTRGADTGVTVEVDIDATTARVRQAIEDTVGAGWEAAFELEPIGRTVRLRHHREVSVADSEDGFDALEAARAALHAQADEIKRVAQSPTR